MEFIDTLTKKVKDEAGLTDEQAEKAVDSVFESIALISMNNNWRDVDLIIDPDDEYAIVPSTEDVEDET